MRTGREDFESDRVRKAMFGVQATEKLPSEAYRPDISGSVYETLCDDAAAALASRGTVIVDAVFDKPGNRDLIERVASAARVPFVGIWLNADHSTLASRIESRRNSTSDATVEVLGMQEARDVGATSWRRIGASQPVAAIAELVRYEVGTVPNNDWDADMGNPFDAIKLHLDQH